MSTSRTGTCDANVSMKGFLITVKIELVRFQQFLNQAEPRYAIVEYVERFYNH